MFGFKSFWSAGIVIAGIETMQMIRKGPGQTVPASLSDPFRLPTAEDPWYAYIQVVL
jgi:hypothetical protein